MLQKKNDVGSKIVGIVLAIVLVCSIILVQRISAADVSVSRDRDVTVSTPDEPHKITFNMQGTGHMLDHSTDREYTVYECELPAGERLESPYTPVSDNEEEELVFAGWAATPGGEVLEENYIPQADMTVYAVFSRKYTVKFDFNGGYLKDADGSRLLSKTAEYPENGLFTWDYAEVPNYEGGIFAGWTSEADGSGEIPADFRITSDLTVYAQYEKTDAGAELTGQKIALQTADASAAISREMKALSDESVRTAGEGTPAAEDGEEVTVDSAGEVSAVTPADADVQLTGDAPLPEIYSGSVNIEQFAKSAADNDLSAMFERAVSYCLENGVAVIELSPSKVYQVKSLIYLPAGISVEGNGATVLLAYNGYAFGINTKADGTWEERYSFRPRCGISGIKFDNADPERYPRACGVLMMLTGCYIRNCTFRQMYCSIRSYGQYVDNREIANVYFRKSLGDVDLYLNLGDGLILSNLVEGKCKLVNVAGATITNGVQNTFILKECRAVSISGEHDEKISGTHQFINSVVTMENSFFYLTDKPAIAILKKDNNHGSAVTLRNVTFENIDGENPSAEVLAKDNITVGPQCSLRLENVTETLKVKGGHAAAGTGLKINGSFIHPLYQRCMDFSVSKAGKMSVKNTVEISTNYVDTSSCTAAAIQDSGSSKAVNSYAPGTYHFSSKFLIDPERALVLTRGKNVAYTDQTLSIPNAATRLKFRAYGEVFTQTGYLRIYRGKEAHKYDKYVDVPISGLLVDEYLTADDGKYISKRYPWKDRVSSDVDAENACDRYVLLSNGLVEAYMKTVPVTGTWKEGDRVINTDPSANPSGWVCSQSGSPGKWRTIAGETVNANAVTKDQFNDTISSVNDTVTTLSDRADVVFEIQEFKSAGASTISFRLAHKVKAENACSAVVAGGNEGNVSITSVTVDRSGKGKLTFSGNPGSGNTLKICFMYPNGD